MLKTPKQKYEFTAYHTRTTYLFLPRNTIIQHLKQKQSKKYNEKYLVSVICKPWRCDLLTKSFPVLPYITTTGSSGNFMMASWWRHQMETFSALLAICAGNSPVPGEFPAQRPVTRSLFFSLICAWINRGVNNREAGDLRLYRAHCDVIVMWWLLHGPAAVNVSPCVLKDEVRNNPNRFAQISAWKKLSCFVDAHSTDTGTKIGFRGAGLS